MRALPGGGPLLLANMTEFGKTPIIPVADFEKAGSALLRLLSVMGSTRVSLRSEIYGLPVD